MKLLNKISVERVIGGLKFLSIKIKYFNRLSLEGNINCIEKNSRIRIEKNSEINIGKKIYVCRNGNIGAFNNSIINIGYNNFFNSNINLISFNKITIGNNNLFGPNVVIVDHNHNYSDKNKPFCMQGYVTKEIYIGNNVWLGANVVVLPGSIINDNVVIAANSVVKGVLEKNSIYAGNPVVLVKKI